MSDVHFGYFWFSLTCLNFAVVLGKFGYDTASLKFISHYVAQKQWESLVTFIRHRNRKLLQFTLLTSFFGALLLLGLSTHLDPMLLSTLLFAALLVPLQSFAQVQEQSLRALHKVWVAQFPLALLRPAIFILLATSFYALTKHLSSETAVLVQGLAFVTSLIVLWQLWRRYTPIEAESAETAETDPTWSSTARAMILASSFTIVLYQSDILLTGLLLGTTDSGYYVVASRISGLIVFFMVAINYLLAPIVSRSFATGNSSEMQSSVTIATQLSFGFAVVVGGVLVFFSKPLLNLFGSAFTVAAMPLIVLIAGQIINALTGPVTLLLNMTDRQQTMARVMAASAGLNILINVLLLPILGLLGAALATAVTNAAANLWMATIVRRDLGIRTVASLLPTLARRRADRGAG